MEKKRPVFYGVVVATLMCAGLALEAAPYEVTGPDAPKPHEQTAMKELSDYLGKRVAGTLRVGGKDGIVFRVGDTELARKNRLLSTQLPSEKWVIRSFGNEVLLNGGGPRGALFAVYHFLEDCCGVRWWSEFEEDVPPAGPLDLPALDMQGRPTFAYRDIYRSEGGANPPRFERRVRLNAHGDAALGGAHKPARHLPVERDKGDRGVVDAADHVLGLCNIMSAAVMVASMRAMLLRVRMYTPPIFTAPMPFERDKRCTKLSAVVYQKADAPQAGKCRPRCRV